MEKITQSMVLAYAEVVRAVQERSKITMLRPDGERLTGTLRALTPRVGSSSYLHDGDLRTASIWITTTQGFETWVRFLDVVRAVQDSEVSWDVYA